ncbi:MAG: ABC transporter substrate-binding protein [Deltaproteobacteria bacterium]|nr:ABC transporter substrate-binding protein [Deltaproteobacteria bacterium]
MTEVRGRRSEASKGTALGALLLALSCFIAVLVALCSSGNAQQREKINRIGFLGFNDPASSKEFLEAFQSGLRELGYIEGQNIVVEYRWAEGKPERLPRLGAELVSLKVDVIFAAAASSVKAAKNATKTIPIVFETLTDPVSAGFVNSLANPGANLTGIAGLAPELSGKRLELLKEVVRKLALVSVLANPMNPNFHSILSESEKAALALNLRLQVIELRQPIGVNGAFEKMTKERADALTVVPDSMLFAQRKAIVTLALQKRLPAVYGMSGVAEIGGLMAYSPNQREMWRRAATYVDKILKGAKPADLPVEQPTKFELVINLKTAKQIGLTIPPNVLARADKVIK